MSDCPPQVHHPHAVRFFGACTKRQPYMIVTEFLPGGSLADVFAKCVDPNSNPNPLESSLQAAAHLCNTLRESQHFERVQHDSRRRIAGGLSTEQQSRCRGFALPSTGECNSRARLPHAATASVGVQHGMLLMRWCYTACRRTTAGAYMPDMRRAVVIALDTCKGMAYLHRHRCATLCRRL